MVTREPKMWQNNTGQNNLENDRISLLKQIHQNPECQSVHLELFRTELMLCFNAKLDEDKERQLKKANDVWRNGKNKFKDIDFLFNSLDICIELNADDSIIDSIKEKIWSKRITNKTVWSYVASKELQGIHWKEVEEFCDDNSNYSNELKYFIGAYKEALNQFSDEALCEKFMVGLLHASDLVCTDSQKISAVKDAWLYGLDKDVLSTSMYEFGFLLIDMEDEEECLYLMSQFK